MKQSMVDYVLERGNRDYGEFYRRSDQVEPSLRLNQRKLLEYLFNPDKSMKSLNRQNPNQPSISELKHAEIVTQFNYVSEKLHTDMNKKNVVLDAEIYKLEQLWMGKKIPQFYCYYFLKFCYANKPSRLQDIVFEQQANMSKQNDSYTVIRKAIEAREACLSNLRRQAVDLVPSQIEKDLTMIQQEIAAQAKQRLRQEAQSQRYKTSSEDQPLLKDWKNKLELLFDSISHLRKLTLYVVDMITKWKHGVYALTEDPKRFRERIIFYQSGVNYLIKILNDSRFLKEMHLGDYLSFSECYDPFVLRPLVVMESQERNVQQSILYSLMKPKETEMKKIINCLEILAEEEYDEDSHTRFLNEKKNTGELKFRKDSAKKLHSEETPPKHKTPANEATDTKAKTRSGSVVQLKASETARPNAPKDTQPKNVTTSRSQKIFSVDKRSMHTKKVVEETENKKNFATDTTKVRQMTSLDLKKISPYLARNQKIQLAKKVIELEHEYKQAKALYAVSTRKDFDEMLVPTKPKEVKDKEQEVPDVEELKKYSDNRVFNKYVQQNLRKLEEADKKKYLYKNRLPPDYEGPKVNYKKLKFEERKEFKYNESLKELVNPLDEKKEEKKIIHSPEYKAPGTRAIIEISDIGIKKREREVLFTNNPKTVGEAIQKASTEDFRKKAIDRIYPEYSQMQQDDGGLYELGRKPDIVVLRQQPEKLEEIKNFLYAKIKAELTEQITRQNKQREDNISDLINQQKRKRASQLIEQQELEQRRKREEEERQRLEQLERERNKINPDMSVEPIQYSEDRLEDFLTTKLLALNGIVFSTLFGTTLEKLLDLLTEALYTVIFRVKLLEKEIGYVVALYDDSDLYRRKWAVKYIALEEVAYSVSAFHHAMNYLWQNDPVEEILMQLIDNKENVQGNKILADIQEYADRNGLSFSKQLYSNTSECRYVFMRNTELYPEGAFLDGNNLYGKSLVMKVELMSANIALTEGTPSRIDLNLEQNTHYLFLLEELFRSYMTPEEVVELRDNTQNIRRLKDIFKIVLDLQKNKPKVNEFHVVEGLNMDDLNDKIRQQTVKPYQRYYWKEHYDMDRANRILLAILEQRLQLNYSINSCNLNDQMFMRIRIREKLLLLRSSISPKDTIYILPTKNEKLKLFIMSATIFKQMRIQLFMFLNLIFNNIVRDDREYIENMWLRQFKVNLEDPHANKFCKKQVTRVTDFSITMKKNIWLTEDLYFCNKEYIKSGVSYAPSQTDLVMLDPYIYGILHNDIEKESTGVPLFAKLIDRQQYYTP